MKGPTKDGELAGAGVLMGSRELGKGEQRLPHQQLSDFQPGTLHLPRQSIIHECHTLGYTAVQKSYLLFANC